VPSRTLSKRSKIVSARAAARDWTDGAKRGSSGVRKCRAGKANGVDVDGVAFEEVHTMLPRGEVRGRGGRALTTFSSVSAMLKR
jgi:hypothetical protein